MTTAGAAETALIVAVPEAEASVGPFRDRHDPSAAAGCPAHVTLLYPFRPPEEIDAQLLGALRACFAAFAPFAFSLAGTRRFPGVLYLAPEPAAPFRRMTLAVWALSPGTPPYGGRHADIVPHLCIAQLAEEASLDRVADAYARASRGMVPIRATATEAALIDNRSGRWRVRARFGLGLPIRSPEAPPDTRPRRRG